MKENNFWYWFWVILIIIMIISSFSNYLSRRSYYREVMVEDYYSGCSCSSNLYNCDDFSTQREAQTCFERCGVADIHYLDGDDDGRACETLP